MSVLAGELRARREARAEPASVIALHDSATDTMTVTNTQVRVPLKK
jgi:hypothetical protein